MTYNKGLFYQGELQGADKIARKYLPFYKSRTPTHNLYNCLDRKDGPSHFNFIEDLYRDEWETFVLDWFAFSCSVIRSFNLIILSHNIYNLFWWATNSSRNHNLKWVSKTRSLIWRFNRNRLPGLPKTWKRKANNIWNEPSRLWKKTTRKGPNSTSWVHPKKRIKVQLFFYEAINFQRTAAKMDIMCDRIKSMKNTEQTVAIFGKMSHAINQQMNSLDAVQMATSM